MITLETRQALRQVIRGEMFLYGESAHDAAHIAAWSVCDGNPALAPLFDRVERLAGRIAERMQP